VISKVCAAVDESSECSSGANEGADAKAADAKAADIEALDRRETDGAQHTRGVGTLRYMAPEVFAMHTEVAYDATCTADSSRYDERCDVYSFSLLVWEMTHGQIVFDGKTSVRAAIEVAKGGRPEITLPAEHAELGELICACWQREPSARPSMPACVEQIARMLAIMRGAKEAKLPHAVDRLESSVASWGAACLAAGDWTAKLPADVAECDDWSTKAREGQPQWVDQALSSPA